MINGYISESPAVRHPVMCQLITVGVAVGCVPW